MILITEFINEDSLNWLRQRANCVYDPDLYRKTEVLASLISKANGLIVRNRTRVNSELLQLASNLNVVGRLGVGLDNLDCSALAKRRITTVYAPGASARSVAEFCLMLMLALSKKLLQADTSVRSGLWERTRLAGQELFGKTVGIIGLGAVGNLLAEMCRSLGCRLLVYTLPPSPLHDNVDLHTLLSQADYVSLNIPLTPQTAGMIGSKEIELMQPHAYLLNTSRGEVIDEAALYDALKARRIAGAALDVRHLEPPKSPDRFTQLDNVILTPHLAGVTEEAQAAVCQMVVEDIWQVLQGKRPVNPVLGLNFVDL